jgi:hypothetical protein
VTFKALVAQAGGPATAVDDEDAEAAAEADVATCDGAGGELDDDDDEQPAASAAQASAATSRPAPASGTAAVTRPAAGLLCLDRLTLRTTFCLPSAPLRAPHGTV